VKRETYVREHDPEGEHHFDLDPVLRPHVLANGMLQFTPETSHHWAGPYPGDCARWSLQDYHHHRLYKPPFPARQEAFEAQRRWYEKNYPNPDKSMRAFIRNMTVDNCEHNYSHPTAETPVALRLYGNDDTSYTKFYPTVEAAQAELDLFLACEPLDFQDVLDAGFRFTN